MKKLMILAVLCAAFAVSASAVTFSPWVGYGLPEMLDAKAYMTAQADSFSAAGSTCTITGINEIYSAGFDVGMFRIGWHMPLTPSVQEIKLDGTKMNYDYRMSLATAMVGLRLFNPAKAIMNVGVFGGYGYALVATDKTIIEPTLMPTTTVLYTGMCMAYEGVIGLKFGPIELNAGYRMARIPEVKTLVGFSSHNDAIIDIPAGTVLEKAPGEPLVFDYTSTFATIGFRFGGAPSKSAPMPMPPQGFKY